MSSQSWLRRAGMAGAVAVLFAVAACAAGQTVLGPSGELTVVAVAEGTGVPSEFRVVVDAENEKTVVPNGRVKFGHLETGTHTVGIRLPGNCAAASSNPRVVEIAEDETTTETFQIQCV